MFRDEEQYEKDRPPRQPLPQRKPADEEPPETALHPAPHIRHAREPSAENLMPAEDEPGTF
jgi:hypothetical protein